MNNNTHSSNPVIPRKIFASYQLFQGKLLPWLVLAIILLATYLMWQNEQQDAINDVRVDFDFRVREADTRIKQRMKAYEQILRGVRAAFIASHEVTRGEFREYVDSLHLKDNYPGTRNIGFTRVLPVANKGVSVDPMRRDGVPSSAIQSGGHHEFYTSVTYLEPPSGYIRFPMGSDMYSVPALRAAMEQARDSDHAANSGKILLPQGVDEDVRIQSGFLMYLPVYKTGRPHTTIAERRANIIGWVYASFRMIDLMTGILGEISNEIDIEVHDGESVSEETMMYDPDLSGVGGNPDSLFKSISRIEVANHYWTVVIRSLYGFEMRVDRNRATFVAYVGIQTGILLALLSWLLVHGRERALQAAEALNRELAERKRAEEGLRLAAIVFKSVEEAVLVTDSNNLIITVNPAFSAITGYLLEDVIGRNPRIFASGKHSKEFYKELWDTLLATGSWHGEIWDKRKSGKLYVKWISIRLVRDDEGRITHHVAVFSDISERKIAEERMHHLAHYDVLTDLPNRVLFTERLKQEISRAERDKQDKRDKLNKNRMALMFLDLDNFKPINDTLGHAVGDLLLKEVARRLLDCVRESDIVSRLGGDEFVVLLPTIEAEQDAMMVADKILYSLGKPFEFAGQSLRISVSIGLVLYPDHGSEETVLTKNADIAMYYAKASGRNNVKLYKPDMLSETGVYRALDITQAKPEPPRNRE